MYCILNLKKSLVLLEKLFLSGCGHAAKINDSSENRLICELLLSNALFPVH